MVTRGEERYCTVVTSSALSPVKDQSLKTILLRRVKQRFSNSPTTRPIIGKASPKKRMYILKLSWSFSISSVLAMELDCWVQVGNRLTYKSPQYPRYRKK